MKLHIYWFSGAGNTLQAAEVFAKRLQELGWDVKLRPIEKSDPTKINPAAVFGLAFPTYSFSIPVYVKAFVKSLPQVNGTEAMMLGTHGALSGGVMGPLKRLLTQKGFKCRGARIISMPCSYFPFTGEETNRKLLNRGMEQVKRYADDFNANAVSWSRWPILSDVYSAGMSWFFGLRKICRATQTSIHTRVALCSHCGTCVKLCPVNALKQESPEHPPVVNDKCTNCLRCVAVCPTDAMRHFCFSPYRSEPADELKTRFENEM
ncbi:MAG: EFR1 family ferrodoxin [Thermoguttaceae bacterium]